ncbi:uncharacterized protein LOC116451045 [Corvus moneduloides]|uniref:uncharacterized protein LOC116451045 n=1 Tax=Corvus moneduloides TaxID=1196302 RepID=UPI00136346AC|nr:uncharacterized protein LOC116451045 [Corvus moneduloides]
MGILGIQEGKERLRCVGAAQKEGGGCSLGRRGKKAPFLVDLGPVPCGMWSLEKQPELCGAGAMLRDSAPPRFPRRQVPSCGHRDGLNPRSPLSTSLLYSCPSPGGYCPGGWTLSRLDALPTARGSDPKHTSRFPQLLPQIPKAGAGQSTGSVSPRRGAGLGDVRTLGVVCCLFIVKTRSSSTRSWVEQSQRMELESRNALGWKEIPAVDAPRVETSTDGAARQSCKARPGKRGHQETSCKLSAELWKTSQELQQEEFPGSRAAPGMCPTLSSHLEEFILRVSHPGFVPAEVCLRWALAALVGDAEAAPVLLQERTPGLVPLPEKLTLQRRNKRGPGQGVTPE